MRKLAALLLSLILIASSLVMAQGAPVKMSRSGIAHAPGTTYLQPNQALDSLQVAATLFRGWWKEAKEMKKSLSKNCKIVASAFAMVFLLNTQAIAQVQTGLMKCNDRIKNINFSVHFKGSEVLLFLKGFMYRVPYTRSFVSKEGERWSVYENREIRVSTTVPYDKYVAIDTVPSYDLIAHFICE